MMIKGFRQLKTLEGGELIRFVDGVYAVVTEYGTAGNPARDAYLLESGERLHADPDEWVAVIDLRAIEAEMANLEYPKRANDER